MSFPFNTFVTRHFYLFILGTLACCAFYFAKGVNYVLADQLTEHIDAAPLNRSSSVSKDTGGAPSTNKSAIPSNQDKIVLSRNIFSSVIGPIDPSGVPASEVTEVDTESVSPEEMPVVPCGDTFHKVLATVVSEHRPEWSFASIATKGEKALYRLGDEIGDKKIFGISWHHVFLEGSDEICYIDLFGENNLKAVSRKSFRAKKSKIPRRFRNQVSQIGPHTREISRKLANRLSRNPEKYAKRLRLRQYKKNGKVEGFRVRRLSRNSPFSALGLKRGDVINSVNGTPLTSIAGAMDAYRSLKDKNDYSFEVTRRGKPVRLNVKVK